MPGQGLSQNQLVRVLEFRAPFLIEKLLKERIVSNESEGLSLFEEVLRYIVLDRLYPEKRFQMYSRRVDEVWHQFVLFTYEYQSFCYRYLGSMLHHFPGNAPGASAVLTSKSASCERFAEFQDCYRRVFARNLPEIWIDRLNVTVDRRMLMSVAGCEVLITPQQDRVVVAHPGGDGFIVSAVATDALLFMRTTKAFYVRELPGLDPDEQIGLVEVMVGKHFLMLAS